MKTTILLCIIVATANNLFSGEATVKLQALQKQAKNNIIAKDKLRVKLITSDAEINRLHKRIMALHKELALKINAKKSMRLLIEQQTKLTEQIRLQKQAVKIEQQQALAKEKKKGATVKNKKQ
jgi:hypothetical protein